MQKVCALLVISSILLMSLSSFVFACAMQSGDIALQEQLNEQKAILKAEKAAFDSETKTKFNKHEAAMAAIQNTKG